MARITTGSDAPVTLTKASASRKLGTIWKASTTRISASSISPPAKPASVPTSAPTTMRDGRRGDADGQRGARAVHQAGQHVASEPVGAERKGGVGEGRHQRRADDRQRIARETGPAQAAPSSTSRQRIASPATPSGERSKPPEHAHAGCLRRADARVEQGIGEVDEEVDQDHQHGADDDDADQQRRVAPGDRLLRQPPEARNGKDALDDDAAAEHGRGLQAEHGDQRQQRVARDVAQHDAPARQPLGARGEREILAPDLGHAGAHHPQEQRQIDEAECGDRQHQMAGDVERAFEPVLARRDGFDARRSGTSAAARRRRRSAPGRARSSAPRRAPASRSTARGRARCRAARRRRCRAASRG